MRSNSRKIIYFCYIPGVGKVGSLHRSLAKVRPHMIAQGAQLYVPLKSRNSLTSSFMIFVFTS